MHHLLHVVLLAIVFFPSTQAVFARDILDVTRTRHGEELKEAFRDLVIETSHYAVQLQVNRKGVVPACLINATRGLVASKLSLIEEYVDEDDTISCLLDQNEGYPAELLTKIEELDLVIVKARIPSRVRPDPVRIAKVQKIGQWVVSLEAQKELPVGIGVLGAAPREILSAESFLGLNVEKTKSGLEITKVMANSGAARSGLKTGDLLMKTETRPARERNWLADILNELEPGDWFTILARRDGKVQPYDVQLGMSWDNVVGRQSVMNRFGSDVSLRRSGFSNVFQHDTIMHPESCGGPIVNLDGELMGINIARAGRTDTLAVPIADILKIIEDQE